MFIGICLIILGAILLLKRLGIIHGAIFDYLLPAVLIAFGVHMVTKQKATKQ